MMKLIQRSVIFLVLLSITAIILMACGFTGLGIGPETEIGSESVAIQETEVLTEDPAMITETPFQSIFTSTSTSTQLPTSTSIPALTFTPTSTPSPTASPTPTIGYPPDPKPLPGFDASRLGEMDHNVIFCIADDGTKLKMNVHYPEVNTGPWPVMMWVHGGGWSGGHKGSQSWFPDFTDLGLIGVTIDYRLSPDVIFPAHIEDVKCAVRYLRANAAHFNLDPARILAFGGSAGGHLVSLLGTTGDSGEYNVGQYLDQSSAVQSVIAISAPTDLVNWGCVDADRVESYYQNVFGSDVQCGEYDSLLADASPLTYVTPQDVPFLFLAGIEDEVVPYQNSETMYISLLNVGVPSQLLLVDGGGHDLSVPDHPEREDEVMRAIIEFTLEQLDLPWPDWLEKE